MKLFDGQQEMTQVMQGNHAETQEKLEHLLDMTRDMQAVLRQPESEIRSQMQAMQEVIHTGVPEPEQRETLQRRLMSLHRQTELLPPMIDRKLFQPSLNYTDKILQLQVKYVG